MYYILVNINGVGEAYQEITRYGNVVRYTDLEGNTLFTSIPSGVSSSVINATPTQPLWAVPDPIDNPTSEPAPSRRLTKLGFVGLLGSDFPAILTASKQSLEVELFVRMLDWATPDPDGTSVDLDDPRVIYALNQLEAAGVIGTGRATEILNA